MYLQEAHLSLVPHFFSLGIALFAGQRHALGGEEYAPQLCQPFGLWPCRLQSLLQPRTVFQIGGCLMLQQQLMEIL